MRKAQTLRGWSGDRTKIQEPPSAPKGGSKKNTRKWCKGKPGVVHQPGWIEYHGMSWRNKLAWRRGCLVCLKHLWDLAGSSWAYSANVCYGYKRVKVPGSCACPGDSHPYGCGYQDHEIFHCICGNHEQDKAKRG